MGIVYLLDSDSATPMAIAAKTFRPEFPVAEIVRELNIWLDLSHPNILRLEFITVLEFETAAVSPWRHGGNLREHLVTKRTLNPSEVKRVLGDAVAALRYAWETKHIVHLDIKPQNMLMSGVPWKFIEVSDWGLARISSEVELRRAKMTPESVHLASTFAGTVPYMAPERFIAGVPASVQADVFSLGVLALECLTGSLPFTHETNLIEQILSGAYILRSTHAVKGLNSRWRQFLSRCLAYDKNQRFDSYPEMQQALDRL